MIIPKILMAPPERITQFCGIITRFTLQGYGQTNLNCYSRKCTALSLQEHIKKPVFGKTG